jgi:WD40 repeat protein
MRKVAAFLPFILTGLLGGGRCWAQEAKERAALVGHTDNVLSLAFSPDGQTLASGGMDRTVKLWDVKTGKQRATLRGHTGWVVCLAFCPDGKLLASADPEDTVRLWDMPPGRERDYRIKQAGQILSVAFSPDGRTLAVGGSPAGISAVLKGQLRLWDVATGKERLALQGLAGVWSVAFSPDGQTLAVGDDETSVKLCDLASGKVRARLEGHQQWVNSVAFAADGKLLASGSEDRMVLLWDMPAGKLRARLRAPSLVTSIAFAGGKPLLACGSVGRAVRLWDTTTGKEVLTLEAEGMVNAVSFSPDGKTLAVAVRKTVKLWDVASLLGAGRLRRAMSAAPQELIQAGLLQNSSTPRLQCRPRCAAMPGPTRRSPPAGCTCATRGNGSAGKQRSQ